MFDFSDTTALRRTSLGRFAVEPSESVYKSVSFLQVCSVTASRKGTERRFGTYRGKFFSREVQ